MVLKNSLKIHGVNFFDFFKKFYQRCAMSGLLLSLKPYVAIASHPRQSCSCLSKMILPKITINVKVPVKGIKWQVFWATTRNESSRLLGYPVRGGDQQMKLVRQRDLKHSFCELETPWLILGHTTAGIKTFHGKTETMRPVVLAKR